MPLGTGRTVVARPLCERLATLEQPGLEGIETTDGVERLGRGDDFEQPTFFEGMSLFTGDDRRGDGLGLDQGEGEGVLRFQGGESTGGGEGCFPEGGSEISMTGEPGGFDDAVENEIEFRGTGQSQVETGDLALEFRCQRLPHSEEDEKLAGGAGVAEGVTQLAVKDGILVLKEGTEIPQKDEGIVLEVKDLVEGHGRIRTGLDRAEGRVDKSLGRAPRMEGTLEFIGGGFDNGFGTRLFGGAQKKAGVTGPRITDDLMLHGIRGSDEMGGFG
jgi:hypothetical protein